MPFLRTVGLIAHNGSLFVLGAGVLLFVVCAVAGIPKARYESDVSNLWVKSSGEVSRERRYQREVNTFQPGGGDTGTSNHLLISVDAQDDTENVLTRAHLEESITLLKAVRDISVVVLVGKTNSTPGRLVNFYTEDLCQCARPYQFQCVRLTVADCFKEGGVDLPMAHKLFLKSMVNASVSSLANAQGLGTTQQDELRSLNQSYDSRPSAKTASGQLILDTISAGCKLWDDPFFDPPLLPAVPKELVVGGVSWDANFPTGWLKTAPMTKANPRPWDRARGPACNAESAAITKATAVEQVHRTISAHTLRNRLMGLDYNGRPFAANRDAFFQINSRRGHAVNVTLEEAKEVLAQWEQAFVGLQETLEVKGKNVTKTYAYGANSFSNALEKYGTMQPGLVAGGYAAIICFAFIALSIDGSTRLGLASALGALLVGASIAAGFGISAVLGVPTNPASLQVLPFLLIAVGINDMFVMSHAAIQCQHSSSKRNWMEHTVVEAGPSITLTSVTLFVTFTFVRLIDIPVVIDFATVAAVCTLMMWFSNVVLFPCLLYHTFEGNPDRCASVRQDKVSDQHAGNHFYCCIVRVLGLLHKYRLLQLVMLCAGASFLVSGGIGFEHMELGLHQMDIAPTGTRFRKAIEYRLDRFPFLPCSIKTRSYDFSTPANQLRYANVNERLTALDNVIPRNSIWLANLYAWADANTTRNTGCNPLNANTRGVCGPSVYCRTGWVKAGVGGVPRLYNPATRTGMFYTDMTNATMPTNTTCSFDTHTNMFRAVPPQSSGALCRKTHKGDGPADPLVAERLSKEDKDHTDWCMALPQTPVGFVPAANKTISEQLSDAAATTGFFATDITMGMRECIEEWLQSDDSAQLVGPGMNSVMEPDPSIAGVNRTRERVEWENVSTSTTSAQVAISSFDFNAYNLISDGEYIKLIEEVRDILYAANAASEAQPFFPSGDPFVYWDQYRTLKVDLVKWVAIEFAVGFFVCWG
eukprot:g2724.t1